MSGSTAHRYGRLYWCVLVPKTIAANGEIYLFADKLTIQEGSLLCWQTTTFCVSDDSYSAGDPQIMLAFAPGNWTGFFGASCIDGHAVSAEHWQGQILEENAPRQMNKKNASSAKHKERARMHQGLRYRVMKRDGFKCKACGKTPEEHGVVLEVDHILAVAKGGKSDEANLQTLCLDCNRDKHVL